MARSIEVTGIHLHANSVGCSHFCRYCQLKTAKPTPIPFERFQALVERFVQWNAGRMAEKGGGVPFEIAPWYGNSQDYDDTARSALAAMNRKLGYGNSVLLLGGLSHRSGDALRDWLGKQRDDGVTTIVGTFSGHGKHHDFWNNKEGNYRFQMDALRTAVEMGFSLQQRVLLMRDTMAGLGDLFDDLDALGGGDRIVRWSIPLFYSGLARRLEDQRLTKADFDALPDRVLDTLREDHVDWKTEGEWMEHLREREEEPERIAIHLPITMNTLDWGESRACDEIVAELESQWKAAYDRLPSRRSLGAKYGRAASGKVYMHMAHLDHRWMDQCVSENPGRFDLRSTHFG